MLSLKIDPSAVKIKRQNTEIAPEILEEGKGDCSAG